MSRVEQIAEGVTLYLGDCREILPTLGNADDVVITDPPYPRLEYGWEVIDPRSLGLGGRQFWFWMLPPEPFPLPFSALHVWSKSNVYIGDHEIWEPIYEVNGKRVSSVLREAAINGEVGAQMSRDQFYDHPTQKPLKLMLRLIRRTTGSVLDPFMGSGTTGVAAVKLGRPFRGIEKEPKYFDIACKRISEATKQQDFFIEKPKPAKQAALFDEPR